MKTNRTDKASAPRGAAKRSKQPGSRRGRVSRAAGQITDILEMMSDGFVAFDREMNYTYINKRGGELLGRPPEDLIGKNYWTEYPDAKGTPFAEAYLHALQTRQPVIFEDYYAPWNRWFENRIYPSPGGLSVFFHDITDRKQVEETLRKSEQKFSKIFHASPVPMTISRLSDGRYLEVNDSYLKHLGYQREEILGKTALEIGAWVNPEDRARLAAELREHGSAHELATRYRMKTGRPGDILLSAELIELEGEPCILGVSIDITERQAAERELRLSRDRLAELSRRLVQVHETEQRAIGRELHDQIGQMLTALHLILEIIPQLGAEAARKKLAAAEELVQDLMNRVSQLSLELRPPMLDDLGLVPALLWQVNRYQEQTAISVDLKYSGVQDRRFDPEIETSAYRLIQEALTNVARHARATHVRLDVLAGEEQMEIRVEDNGIGFDPAAAFAENRGLSGMRERVSLLGGTFQVESQIGRGARKLIRLPLREKAT